jgi:hypothetical protein
MSVRRDGWTAPDQSSIQVCALLMARAGREAARDPAGEIWRGLRVGPPRPPFREVAADAAYRMTMTRAARRWPDDLPSSRK